MTPLSNLPRWVFRVAAFYGILVLLPQYFLELGLGPALPEPMQRPEQFYGFVGVALVWQLAFLLIAADPIRYRRLMLVGVLEKLAFAVPVALLFVAGRVDAAVLVFGMIDLMLGLAFIAAFRATPSLP
ncbi:MAG: hypothetical protein ABIZ91_18930 [Gemmatimonadaceae bacterium]